MRDPYQSLDLPRSATADDIKKSFRQLAKKLHPDTNKDDPKAAALFAEIRAAHDILGDTARRRAFDRGHIDANGKPAAERAARAVSGLTLSVAGLIVALVVLVSTGIVRNLIPSPSDTRVSVSRSGLDEELDLQPDPSIWSGSRIVFPKSVSYVAPDTIPLGIEVSGNRLGLALEISGLPDGATLSRGRPLQGGGGWRILASDARSALIYLPSRFSGTIDLAVELRLFDDSVVDRGLVRLTWAQTEPKQPATVSESARTVARTVSADANAHSTAANSDDEPIEILIGRCEKLVSEGQVDTARVLLTPAAEARDARAALALGSTYDPIMLAVLQAPRVAADIPLALDWYKKAEEFGSGEAEQRLRLLSTALKEPRRRGRGPIHVVVSRAAAPRVAASHGASAAAPSAGERVAAISDPSLHPQLVHDDGRKIPALFGVSF